MPAGEITGQQTQNQHRPEGPGQPDTTSGSAQLQTYGAYLRAGADADCQREIADLLRRKADLMRAIEGMMPRTTEAALLAAWEAVAIRDAQPLPRLRTQLRDGFRAADAMVARLEAELAIAFEQGPLCEEPSLAERSPAAAEIIDLIEGAHPRLRERGRLLELARREGDLEAVAWLESLNLRASDGGGDDGC